MASDQLIPVITIDGPSGSGKGTVGHALALKLGWHYLDSGAVYRILAYAAVTEQVSLTDEIGLCAVAKKLQVRFSVSEDANVHVWLFDVEVTELIRTEKCGQDASKLAVFPKVREALLAFQRAFRQKPGLVTDGRDMGTVVFPDAQLKIFLSAGVVERAKRRRRQLQQKGIHVSLSKILAELQQRDERDSKRQVAPLKPANDAVVIDSSFLGIAEVLERVLQQVNNKLQVHGLLPIR